MTKYLMKELRDLSKEEQAVRKHVLSNLHHSKPKRKHFASFAAAIISIAIVFLLVKIVEPTNSTSNGTLDAHLVEIKGEGVAYNQIFQEDEQGKRELTYYKPLSIKEYKRYHPIQLTLPPTLEHLDHQEVIIVTSDKGMETQFTFKEEEGHNSEFLIISVSNSDINPSDRRSEDYQYPSSDPFSNKIYAEALTEDTNLLHDVVTTHSMYTYHYYYYEKEENYMGMVATGANWMYTYYKGNIYHIGYSPYSEKLKPDDIAAFVKDFILENADSFERQNQPR